MKISSAKFHCSSSKMSQCPKPVRPEFAFIGRSNVGKSSLINMVCGNNKLAKTSGTPGKTKLINHFIINEEWYLVDLPGYGFAKASKKAKEEFENLISVYCKKRENLICLFILIDSRHNLQDIDAEFMRWCGENEIPFILIFTKTDKLGKVEFQKNLAKYKKDLLKEWEELPQMLLSSAEKGLGKAEILNVIDEHKKSFVMPPKEVLERNEKKKVETDFSEYENADEEE